MKRYIPRWVTRWLSQRQDGSPKEASHEAMSHAPMLDCESVIRQLWDYLDGELTPERMAASRAHLEMCERCYPQYKFERSFLDAVGASTREHSNPDRLRETLMAALQAEGLSEA